MFYIADQYDHLLQNNKQIILNGIVGAATPSEVESSAFFARYLRTVGITPNNYWLFLRILESNNKYIVDELVGDNDPRIMFTIIKPTHALLERAFQLITLWHPGQIFSKVLLAVLGIIEYCYHSADEGFSIHPLDISEINNVGKFLNQSEDQFDLINAAILDIMDRISHLGEYANENRKSILAKHAYNVRMGYFDNTKKLTDIIPQVLLVRLIREKSEIKPSTDFLAFMEKLHNTNS
ncbi:MAG: hypothetical protein KAU17_09470 [Spirochaetales bacterium]|nr:hypothetical protein [Spirochaetales bacterium]